MNGALALWRGEPFSGLRGPLIEAERRRLAQRHVEATESRAVIMLDRGLYSQAIADLTRLVSDHPLQERLRARLMRALYHSGRQADALAVFQDARVHLANELGVDPGSELSDLHQQILRAELPAPTPEFTVPKAPPPMATRVDLMTREPVRNDLPGDIADFTGRRDELVRVLTARTSVPHAASTAVVIEAIDGMAGIGKTTLAVHAAHRLAEHYPDAQLFIDLHGHTSAQRPVTPMAALGVLLRALGVPADKIPNDLDARAAMWRSELANRSVLVILDNAADADQVRPLLPGTAHSLTLITSRRRLADLETAHTLSLDVLSLPDAVALFTTVVGDSRPTREHEAALDVVEQCGRLPLAVQIAAARLRTRPAWTVRHLADRLRQAGRPLVELSAGGRSVAAAFALSYANLDDRQRRMFCLLGVHPGPDFDVAAAASLAAVDLAEAERLLESLVDDQLLQQLTAGRYRFHDLVRQHAHDTAAAEEPAQARQAALGRVVDFYLHTGYAGSRLLDHQHPPISLEAAAEGSVPTPLPDAAAAMMWFDDNHHCVNAARDAAEDAGWDTAVWHLAWILDNFHYRRGMLHDNIVAWEAGLAAGERLGDLAVQGRGHRRLGLVYAPLGKRVAAVEHLERSLVLSEQAGDTLGQAGAHFVLAMVCLEQGDDRRALDHATIALARYEKLGNTEWEVRALNMTGACHTRLGHHEEALVYCGSALLLCRQRNDVYGEADSLTSLGAIAHHTGQYNKAILHYQEALAIWRDIDNACRQADTLAAIGDTLADLGHGRARDAWRLAIDLYRSQHRDTDADRTARRLAGFGAKPHLEKDPKIMATQRITGPEPATSRTAHSVNSPGTSSSSASTVGLSSTEDDHPGIRISTKIRGATGRAVSTNGGTPSPMR